MNKFLLVLVLVVVFSHAKAIYTNETLAGCSLSDYTASCTSNGYTGACVSISAGCCSTGTQTSNLCPGLFIYSLILLTRIFVEPELRTNSLIYLLTSFLTYLLTHYLPTYSIQAPRTSNAAPKVLVPRHMAVVPVCKQASAASMGAPPSRGTASVSQTYSVASVVAVAPSRTVLM